MKLYIEIPNGTKLLVGQTPNSGALLQALTEAQLINENGYGDDKKYELVTDRKIEISVMPDDFIAPPTDIIKKLQEEKKQSDNRWIEYYHKTDKLEKQLKELYADLDAREITYKKVEAASV